MGKDGTWEDICKWERREQPLLTGPWRCPLHITAGLWWWDPALLSEVRFLYWQSPAMSREVKEGMKVIEWLLCK